MLLILIITIVNPVRTTVNDVVFNREIDSNVFDRENDSNVFDQESLKKH